MLEARTPSPRQLRADRVDVWYTWTDALRDPGLLRRYDGVLSEQEALRRDRFVFDRDAHTFRIAHALVRAVLSSYRDVDPQAWSFTEGAAGKPAIAGGSVDREGLELHFNLTHTTGLVACAVGTSPLGVDVEWTERDAATEEVARRSFAPAELEQLESLQGDDYRKRFFELWTLKEALIKADGRGISLGLDRFAFRLEAGEAPTVSFDEALGEDPRRWSFWQQLPGRSHLGAVAVKGERRPTLRLLQTVPFA